MVNWPTRALAVLVLIVYSIRISVQQATAEDGCGNFCCDKDGDVRLLDGRRESEGHVEVCLNGEWGTLCDDHWDNRNAGVICAMLGYHRENAVASKFSRFKSDVTLNQLVVLDDIQCIGSETSILDCPHTRDEDCYNHVENAGVVCEEDTCEEGDVRLMGGSDAKEGRVEICMENTWGAVCSEGWDDAEAKVVCRQLGLSENNNYAMQFGPGNVSLFLKDVQCSGDEANLTSCSSQTASNADQTCFHAGVLCEAPCRRIREECDGSEHYSFDEFCFCSRNCYRYESPDNDNHFLERGDCCRDILLLENCFVTPTECEENDVRIVDGTLEWNGRLEVCLGGHWGGVCEDEFEDIDAAVACRNLGYPYENALAVPGGTFGDAEMTWLRGVECTGVEQNFTHCQSSSPGTFYDCKAHNASGIWCAGAAPANCTEGEVRLEGSLNNMGGRVEICHKGVWGTVCAHEWGEPEARVVCNQLGFTESSSPWSVSVFGPGTGPIVLDDLMCEGTETSLLECDHPGVRVHNCYRNEEAAVTCRAEPVKRCGVEEQPYLSTDTILKYGQFVLYNGSSRICNWNYMYTANVDYLYLPKRLGNDLQNESALGVKLENAIGPAFDAATDECRQLFSTYVCNSIFFRSKNESGRLALPTPLCAEECMVVQSRCPILWSAYNKSDIGRNKSCSHTGVLLDPLPYCCSGEGVDLTQGDGGSSIDGVAIGVSVAMVILLLLVALLALGVYLIWRQFRRLKRSMDGREAAVSTLEMLSSLHSRRDSTTSNGKPPTVLQNHQPASRQMSTDDLARYSKSNSHSLNPPIAQANTYPTLSPISSRYLRQLTTDMLIPTSQLRLLDSIGKGEFGIVYKAHYIQDIKQSRNTMPKVVAVKTLKGYFDKDAIHVLLEESVKMKEFTHANVLTLVGVCVDAGPAPYIVMPYMSKGSLLSYLRKERHCLLLSERDEEEDIQDVRRKMLDIIHQIAMGMAYLAEKKFVHRDLATRNCMMDGCNVIRVSDFGLSEDMYAKNYFRQDKDASVKLPVKWMAPESLNDGIFTEKSDVWSFGVTCWEVFNAGKTPYPGINPLSLVRSLEEGERLEKPYNTACPQYAYDLMMECWNIDPNKRAPFAQIASDIDCHMEVSAGYLQMSLIAERMSPDVVIDRFDSQSPDPLSTSVSQLVKGMQTEAGITIQLDQCSDYGREEETETRQSSETSV